MGKYLMDSTIWKKEWWRKLPPKIKCFWFYVIQNSNPIGIWEADFGLASFMIGEEILPEDINKYPELFQDRFIKLNQSKYFIIPLVPFRYGDPRNFSKNSKIHKNILQLIEKYGVMKLIIDEIDKNKFIDYDFDPILVPSLDPSADPSPDPSADPSLDPSLDPYSTPYSTPYNGVNINKNRNKNKSINYNNINKKDLESINTLMSFVEKWNNFAEKNGIPKVIKLSPLRKSAMKKRLSEKEFDLDAIFKAIEEQPFLLGENKNNWKIDFDFVFLSTNNYLKILEGKYKQSNNKNKIKKEGKYDNI